MLDSLSAALSAVDWGEAAVVLGKIVLALIGALA